jgi:hypothetical protein
MKLLYTAGTARGGTNFRTLILNNHPNLRMSLDPFIPLFRFYRDSLLRAAGGEDLLAHISPSVLDDYYFSAGKMAAFKALRSADPDIPFDLAEWPELKQRIASRMQLASADLIPHLDRLPAPTFREVFHNIRGLIAATTDRELAWVGFNDNWTGEFMPLVAQLVPDARFMLHVRDPRGVVHSSEFAEPDPAKRPTVTSFARHLRKHLVLATMFPADPALADRLLVTRYESFLSDPEGETRRMTEFLGIPFETAMLDVNRFRKADGAAWGTDWAIYRSSADAWRTEMPVAMAELTEFICDPEMRLFGYQPEVFDPERGLSDDALAYALGNMRDCLGWRTDFAEPERTLGSEFARRRLLRTPTAASAEDIERCFLFPAILEKLVAAQLTSPDEAILA